MAYPTIVFNNATGSDTASSGAGPATAVTGTGASLNGTTSVDLSADSPDLSGVATDGSACLWVKTSSGRQFSRITNVDNGTKVVTVATAYSVTESGKTWAIGGKRKTLDNADSRKVFASYETITVTLEDDQTIGSSIDAYQLTAGHSLLVTSNSSTIRKITQTANTSHFNAGTNNTRAVFKYIKFENSNATKTSANALVSGYTSLYRAVKCVFGDGTNKLKSAVYYMSNGINFTAEDCFFVSTTGTAIYNYRANVTLTGCVFSGCNSCVGTASFFGSTVHSIRNCIFYNTTTDVMAFSGIIEWPVFFEIYNSTIHIAGGSGLVFGNNNSVGPYCLSLLIKGCNITGCTTYGISFTSTSTIADFSIEYCNFGTGATANGTDVNGATKGTGCLNVDPGYTNAGALNFSVGENVKAKGFPDSTSYLGAGQTTTYTYVDIGASQRPEPDSNSVLTSAGGNYNDGNLIDSNVKSGVAYGISSTGTYTLTSCVVSGTATSDASISQTESADITCSVTNSPTNVVAIVNDKAFDMDNTGGSNWSVTVYGHQIGVGGPFDITCQAFKTDGTPGTSNTASGAITVTAVTNKTNLLLTEMSASLTSDGITNTMALTNEKTLSGVSGTIRTDVTITCTDGGGSADIDRIRTSLASNATSWSGVSAVTDVYEWALPSVSATSVQMFVRVNHT